MKELSEDPKIIEPLHEIGCACSVCVTERKSRVRSSHPLMDKEIKAQRILIPVDQKIAQLLEAKEMYETRIAGIDLELSILRDR